MPKNGDILVIAKEAASRDERRLAAVMFTDLVGYTALTQGSPEESRERLEEAAGIFRKLGAKRDIQSIEAKLTDR